MKHSEENAELCKNASVSSRNIVSAYVLDSKYQQRRIEIFGFMQNHILAEITTPEPKPKKYNRGWRPTTPILKAGTGANQYKSRGSQTTFAKQNWRPTTPILKAA